MPTWGEWSYSGGNGMRVGVDVQGSAVDTNSASYNIHYWWYVQTQFNYSGDVQALNFAGCYGGNQGYTLNSGHNGVTLVAERDCTHNYTTWGSSPGVMQVASSVSGAYNGSTPGMFLEFAIPARPYAPPNNPAAVTATRNSDTSMTITWGNTATAQRPWTSVSIGVSRWGTSGWTHFGYFTTIGGGSTSFTDNNLSPNYLYIYTVRANNTVGSSAGVAAAAVGMTPAAPSNVQAVLGPTGTTIPITWIRNHYSWVPNITQRIERSVAGGAYAQVATGLAEGVTSWEDPAPGGGTNQYRVKAFLAPGSLSSGWGTSNVVSTVVPPLAPNNLDPDGTAADVEFVGATLTWTHNPGADYAAQTHFTIETSDDGGAVWDALATNVASATSSYTLAPGVLTNGVTYLWKVATQGGVTAAFGPFSTPATLDAETTPTVTLTAPVDPLVALPIGAAWTYAQAEAVPQTAWEAVLYAADGVTILEVQAGAGATAATTFAHPVADGVTYVVAVRAMSGSGMWSEFDTAETTVDLPPPAPVNIDATYDPCTGVVVLELTADAPGVGEVAVDTVTVERRVAGGDWVVLAAGMAVPTTILDMLPLTNGVNEYRATGYSLTPSVSVNPIVTVNGTDGASGSPLWAFVNYGPGWSNVLRVRGDLAIQDKPSRVQAEQAFLGRRKPVLLTGIGIGRELSVSGTLRWADPCPPTETCRYDSPPNDWLAAAWDGGVVAYRDFTGRRLFASIELQIDDGIWRGNASLAMKLTEVDYLEIGGVLFGAALDGGAPSGEGLAEGLCDLVDGGVP